MGSATARLFRLVAPILGLAGLMFLAGCELPAGETPNAPEDARPRVSFVRPDDGAQVSAGDRVSIYAITQARDGIMRVEMLVNDSVIDRQSLTVASRRFDYEYTYRFSTTGQNRVTVVAFDVNGAASDLSTIVVNVGGAAATATTGSLASTATPYIIYVTATPIPSSTVTRTPFVIYVTATRRTRTGATPTRTRTGPAPTVSPTATTGGTEAPTPAATITIPGS